MAMAPKTAPAPTPAELGSLSPEALRDLWLLHEFTRARQTLFAAFAVKRLRRNPQRDEILRLVLLEFGQGRHRRLSFYQRELGTQGSKFATRDEVHRLAQIGVLILENDPTDARSLLVKPSAQFVDWYSNQVPRLKSEWRRLIAAWHAEFRND
jgi:hypothetical protein